MTEKVLIRLVCLTKRKTKAVCVRALEYFFFKVTGNKAENKAENKAPA